MKESKIHNIRISDIIVLIVVNSINSSLEREFCVFHADESRRSNQRSVIGFNSTSKTLVVAIRCIAIENNTRFEKVDGTPSK